MDVGLEVTGMWVHRGRDPEAFRISVPLLVLQRGTLTALVGRSGSGKSTVLEALCFLRRAHFREGRYRLAQQHGSTIDVTDLLTVWRVEALARLRARNIAYVPQAHVLLPFVSARTNMLLAATGADGPTAARRVEEVSAALGIGELLDRRPGQLSVGQRQRVAIGRALVTGAPVLLVDEPTAALDRPNAEAVSHLLVACARTRHVAVLVATHDEDLIRLADRCIPIRMRADHAEVQEVACGP
jgi:putative ABC transport system ATP-binding protein